MSLPEGVEAELCPVCDGTFTGPEWLKRHDRPADGLWNAHEACCDRLGCPSDHESPETLSWRLIDAEGRPSIGLVTVAPFLPAMDPESGGGVRWEIEGEGAT
jgi:hypothetical protein